MKILKYVKILWALWGLRGEAMALWHKVEALNQDESNGLPEIDFKKSVQSILTEKPQLVTQEGTPVNFGLGSDGKIH